MAVASVILCVKNGARDIRGQLDALAAQDLNAGWELLVVDNGSTDGTRDVAEAWFADHIEIDGRIVDAADAIGLAACRNRGAAAARGECLLFCDADDEADPAWASELVAALAAADIAGGTIALERLNTETSRRWQEAERPTTNSGLPTIREDLRYAIGASMGIRASSYWGVGGCDDVLSGAWEEIDLAVRIQLAGGRLAFAPQAVMHYRLRSSFTDVIRQRRHYGRGEADFRVRHAGDPILCPLTARSEGRDLFRFALGLASFPSRSVEERRAWAQRVAYKWGLWTQLVRHYRSGARNEVRQAVRLRTPPAGGRRLRATPADGRVVLD